MKTLLLTTLTGFIIRKQDFLSKEALGLDDGLLVFTEFLEGEPLQRSLG
jgi:hypothetical protein